MAVKLAYRFALDPSPAQARALRSHAGAARFAWNWGLARCKERYAAERRWYSAAELTHPGVSGGRYVCELLVSLSDSSAL